MNDQIVFYMSDSGLFVAEQSVFRSGHSTSSALLKVTNDFHMACNEGKVNSLIIKTYKDF